MCGRRYEWREEAEAEEAEEAEAEFEEPEAEAKPTPVVAPKPAEAKPAAPTPKPKKLVIAGAPVKAKKVDLSFFAWEHKGQDYFTNDRGDVVSTEFEWVGRFDGTKIDSSAPEPEDLGSAVMRE